MAKKRIIVLGAGLAGLSASWHLQKKGVDCQVFEQESDVGGLCRSKNIGGFTFDYSGHLLHFRHRYAAGLIKDLLDCSLSGHKRNAFIYSFKRATRYPFQANLYGLPSSVTKECLLGFIRANNNGHLKDKEDSSFLDWLNSTFGRGIARHFMVPYNNKFWTIPAEELTCEWLDGFIPVPTLGEVIEGTIEDSRRQFGYNARFWYPKKGGINQVPLAFSSQLKNINTNCKIEEINLERKQIKMASGNKERFDYLISTIPLPELPRLIKKLPRHTADLFSRLRWNSVFNLNLGVEKKDSSGRHWVYFPQKEICFFRAGFPHNFSANLVPLNKSSMYVEVAYSKTKPIDKSNIISSIKSDLRKCGLLAQDDRVCIKDTNDIKYGYPIYDNNYNQARAGIIEFLRQNNIFSCGRYGSWRYMSMEDVILDGKRIADVL